MHVEAEDEGGDGGDDGMDGWVEEGPAQVSSTDLAVWLTRSGLLQRVARHCLVPLDVNLHFHIYIHYVCTYICMPTPPDLDRYPATTAPMLIAHFYN